MLDAETEKDLFRQYKRTGDLKARNKIVEGCLRFVVTLASKYTDDIDRRKDLISAGNLGLLCAIDRYDPERSTRFLSYATHWVLLYIRNELNSSNLVSMPLWYQKTVRKLNKEKTKAMTRTGQRASDQQLCQSVGVTKEQLTNLRVDRFRYFSVEELNLSNDGIEMRTMSKETRELLEEILTPLNPDDTPEGSRLSAKECFVVSAYYGFIDRDSWSLAQIANILNVSSERVRQIKEVALEQLRIVLEKKKGVAKTTDACP